LHPETMDKTSEMREEPSAACSDGGCEESLAEVDAFEASPAMDALDAAIQARRQMLDLQEEATKVESALRKIVLALGVGPTDESNPQDLISALEKIAPIAKEVILPAVDVDGAETVLTTHRGQVTDRLTAALAAAQKTADDLSAGPARSTSPSAIDRAKALTGGISAKIDASTAAIQELKSAIALAKKYGVETSEAEGFITTFTAQLEQQQVASTSPSSPTRHVGGRREEASGRPRSPATYTAHDYQGLPQTSAKKGAGHIMAGAEAVAPVLKEGLGGGYDPQNSPQTVPRRA